MAKVGVKIPPGTTQLRVNAVAMNFCTMKRAMKPSWRIHALSSGKGKEKY